MSPSGPSPRAFAAAIRIALQVIDSGSSGIRFKMAYWSIATWMASRVQVDETATQGVPWY